MVNVIPPEVVIILDVVEDIVARTISLGSICAMLVIERRIR
jgi:hypothetical protein